MLYKLAIKHFPTVMKLWKSFVELTKILTIHHAKVAIFFFTLSLLVNNMEAAWSQDLLWLQKHSIQTNK